MDLQKGLTESLAGRFVLHRAHHWSYPESLDLGISLEQYLLFGGYPASYKFLKEPNLFAQYIKNSILETIIGKDILQFTSVRNPALFKQSFELVASFPAREISYTKLLGQLQDKGNTDLIKHYLSLFEGAYLLKTLQKFSSKQLKTKTSSPKIIILAQSLIQNAPEQDKGFIFENAVGAELVRTQEGVYYWRDGNFEVDFVLKHGAHIYAIEVKSGRKKSSLGITEFQKKFPRAKKIFITVENYEKFSANPLGFISKVAT